MTQKGIETSKLAEERHAEVITNVVPRGSTGFQPAAPNWKLKLLQQMGSVRMPIINAGDLIRWKLNLIWVCRSMPTIMSSHLRRMLLYDRRRIYVAIRYAACPQRKEELSGHKARLRRIGAIQLHNTLPRAFLVGDIPCGSITSRHASICSPP